VPGAGCRLVPRWGAGWPARAAGPAPGVVQLRSFRTCPASDRVDGPERFLFIPRSGLEGQSELPR